MLFRNASYCLTIFALFTIIVGCASANDITKLPMGKEDFTLSLVDMRNKFPDVATYEQSNLKFSDYFTRCTSVEEVVAIWGEPSDVKHDWTPHSLSFAAILTGSLLGGSVYGGAVGTGVVLAMYPYPPRTYTWNKGNYKIESRVDTSIFCGYRNRFLDWNFKDTVKEIQPGKSNP